MQIKNCSRLLRWVGYFNNFKMAARENYKAEVVAYTADIGQKINRKKIINNAKKLGVKKVIIRDLKYICKRICFSYDKRSRSL